MDERAPWSVSGVDPGARAAAEALAGRAGLDLGAWLNQFLLKRQAAGPPSPEADPATAIDGMQARVSRALHQLSEAVSRRERAAAPPTAASDPALGEPATTHANADTAAALPPPAGPARTGERIGDRLAALSARLESDRAEMLDQVSATIERRFEAIDQRLNALGEQIDAAQARSAEHARIMRQTIAPAVEAAIRRVEAVERGAQALKGDLQGEIVRSIEVIEARITANAAASLERSRADSASLSRHLERRIAQSEQQAALSCDSLAAQIAVLGKRLETYHEAMSGELGEHIKQAEIRVARLLEDARQRIERELADPLGEQGEDQPPNLPPAAPAVELRDRRATFGTDRRASAGRRRADGFGLAANGPGGFGLAIRG